MPSTFHGFLKESVLSWELSIAYSHVIKVAPGTLVDECIMHEHNPKGSMLTSMQRKGSKKDVCHVVENDDFKCKQIMNL